VETANSSSSRRVERVAWIWQVLLFTALYVVAGLLGLEVTHYNDGVTLVWPPTGLALAALVLFGPRLWSGVFVGSLLIGLSGSLGWIALAGTAIGNSLEALVGATLLVRVADFRATWDRPRDGAAFLLIGVVGCTTISATTGSVSLLLSGVIGGAEFGFFWVLWWLGAAGGVLTLTPVLLMVVHGTPSWMSLIRRLESWLALALLLATSSFAFFGPDMGVLGFLAAVSPFPVLVWAGTRLGSRGAVMASFLIILTATVATGAGSGPFVPGPPTEVMLKLWVYSMFIGTTAFTLAAIIAQRDAAEQRYRGEEMDRSSIEKQSLLLLERERLTREMHDGLGGQLVSVLSMIERGHTTPSEVSEALRRAIDDLRIVIDSLDPDATDLPTSLGQLRARLEPLLRRNGIDLRWRVDDIPGLETFPPEAVLSLLRIIQEAVTNTLRHANADSVELKITPSGIEPRVLHICVRDDGRGLPGKIHSGGHGISNMKSRAEELGAVLRFQGTSSGTQIDLTIPFPR
jgi:signal transduction histidine kinase